MLLIDVHAHLDDEQFSKDLVDVISRAKNAGVNVIINNGLNPKSNRKTLELSKKYDIVKAALGLYPIETKSMSDKEISQELGFIEKNREKIVAIGEVGLDYYWEKGKKNIQKQKDVLHKIIELSSRIKKPLIIHSRKAEEDCVEIISQMDVKKAVLHCFGGNMDLVKKAQENGFYFSVPTSVVFSKHFQSIVGKVPISQLLTETDAPYLSPFKGKRNEPAYIKESVKRIAEIKEMNEEEVANNIFMNWQRLF